MAKKKNRGSHTPLDQHRAKGKRLTPPLADLPGTTFVSWINDGIPERLWSILIIAHVGRDKALQAFREVAERLRSQRERMARNSLSISSLARLTASDFDELMGPIFQDPELAAALAPLQLLDALPGRDLWVGHLPREESGILWNRLSQAVLHAYDHQSQEATDCRWLSLLTLFARDLIALPEHLAEVGREILEYPNRGDQRAVRPTIRSMEMSFRMADPLKTDDATWPPAFWDECWRKTDCIPSMKNAIGEKRDYQKLWHSLVQLYDSVINKFLETITTTAVDAKHDASFGIVMYVLQVLFYALKADVGRTMQGRGALRIALECFITLRFLAQKDDPTIWMQYRNYGAGQSKLAFLKNVDAEKLEGAISLEDLELAANADVWMEFQDIHLGAWTNKNLRAMAEESGVKDVYDRYYDTLSGYVHGNWAAVREAVFMDCYNPLHRLHRIPMPPKLNMPDVVPDLVRLANRCLEELTALYPPFPARLKLDA